MISAILFLFFIFIFKMNNIKIVIPTMILIGSTISVTGNRLMFSEKIKIIGLIENRIGCIMNEILFCF